MTLKLQYLPLIVLNQVQILSRHLSQEVLRVWLPCQLWIGGIVHYGSLHVDEGIVGSICLERHNARVRSPVLATDILITIIGHKLDSEREVTHLNSSMERILDVLGGSQLNPGGSAAETLWIDIGKSICLVYLLVVVDKLES